MNCNVKLDEGQYFELLVCSFKSDDCQDAPDPNVGYGATWVNPGPPLLALIKTLLSPISASHSLGKYVPWCLSPPPSIAMSALDPYIRTPTAIVSATWPFHFFFFSPLISLQHFSLSRGKESLSLVFSLAVPPRPWCLAVMHVFTRHARKVTGDRRTVLSQFLWRHWCARSSLASLVHSPLRLQLDPSRATPSHHPRVKRGYAFLFFYSQIRLYFLW